MNQHSFAGHPRFEIVRQLGRGSVGVVYLARDLEREQEVALKTLSKSDPQALFSLKREFRSLANLHHPNLRRIARRVPGPPAPWWPATTNWHRRLGDQYAVELAPAST